MNLRQLQYFITIARLEHYTKASEKLYVSQSNLSHSIKELEEELNVRLFMRQGRNIKLTKYGELFLPYATKALKILDNGVACLNDYVNPDTGTVVLSGFPSLASFITNLIVTYMSETNRVGVRFQFNQSANYTALREQLLNGDVDLALSTVVEDPEIEKALIGVHPLALIVSRENPLAEHDEVDLRDLEGEPFIAFDNNCELRSFTDRLFGKLDIHPQISMETAQDATMHGMIAAAHATAIMPYPLEPISDRLKVLKIKNDIPKRQIYLSWNRERYMPPAAAYFRDFIIDNGKIFDEFLEARGAGKYGETVHFPCSGKECKYEK